VFIQKFAQQMVCRQACFGQRDRHGDPFFKFCNKKNSAPCREIKRFKFDLVAGLTGRNSRTGFPRYNLQDEQAGDHAESAAALCQTMTKARLFGSETTQSTGLFLLWRIWVHDSGGVSTGFSRFVSNMTEGTVFAAQDDGTFHSLFCCKMPPDTQ
jgi:hypothetical protein